MNPELEFGLEEVTFYYNQMVQSDLLELEIETKQGKLILRRANPDREVVLAPAAPTAVKRRKADAPAEKESAASSRFKPIASPITGVFYRASSPQSPPLVKEGDEVNPGTTLCIVEAMKVMNEIKADSRCKIMKISVENGKPVSKGQALFQVEPL